MKTTNILLISPASDNEALWVTGNEGPQVKNNIVPLGLATVAGMTPGQYHVDIWDELVHGIIDDETAFTREYSIVGITGYKAHLPRCRELAAIFRNRDMVVAIGGPGVSATPEDYRDVFDVLFVGEAERTWPQFLCDWQKGNYRSEYRQIEKIDLAESPLPNWDSIAGDFDKYALGSVQTTRGCPFDCDFCDVIYLFGRRPRQKPIDNVLEEVMALERLGVRHIFFSDDEFIGNRKNAKKLLRSLIALNRSFERPISFSTQTTLTVGRDRELLQLLAHANFDLLFIGIETPNEASLREVHKIQNLGGDLVGLVHTILSYGIGIRAGIIVGFDHDDTDIFDIQYDFIQKSFIPSVAINMLKAPFGTKIWARLRQEGRVVSIPPEVRHQLGHPRSYTTVIPKRMSREELMKGYSSLLEKVFDWKRFAERVRGFISIAKSSIEPKEQTCHVDSEQLASELNADQDARLVIADMISYTRRNAPQMLQKVKALIGQHARYRDSIIKLLPQIDRQIELESSGKLAFEIDRRPIPVPTEFKKEFKKIFPQIHERIYLNMKNKDQVPEALIEVFTDFLVRWGENFNRIEEHHLDYLTEICGRTCTKFNGGHPGASIPDACPDGQIPDVKHIRLADDILKNVEQIIFKISQS